ncbi:VCBS repeat-containing protein [Pedobacter faecalis]|uniref:VCBS repeat-containing protein n=1 Tax=Pedobacter faecalis TaxID=3041495 RepID=UPI002550F82C|nr:VCBS repeat-containing protein [Pedobacter sp. ELA7]
MTNVNLVRAAGRRLSYGLSMVYLLFTGCSPSGQSDSEKVVENPLFKLLDASQTNISFANTIAENFDQNIFNYPAYYNGAGVAAGDLNGDGLDELYFSGNMVGNKLYLNHGNMQFSDITDVAGVAGRGAEGWKNGVNMADVNGDGQLDIYICYSGLHDGEQRKNQLFIHQGLNESGIPVFKDEAEAYGLADSAYSTQSFFFDYDKDGDLDLLLVNENIKVLSELDDSTIQEYRATKDPMSGSKLYRNDNGRFKDVTTAAGISNSVLSYGLSGAISDVNNDGWPDIYLSNDYSIPDHLYINNGDGTFTDKLTSTLDHISMYSMGSNISDINNDGLQDIYTLDMIPEDNKRQKLLQGFDNYEYFYMNLRNGLYYQYMRNMLHVNNGNGGFSEVGQLAGVSNTDWSWAPLFADLDNDGHKDLLVTNGYLHDFTNMDVIKYNDNYFRSLNGQVEPKHILDMLSKLPSSDVKNYVYKNNGNLTFSNKIVEWGMSEPSNSSGAIYSDLDNDGDLDLVVSNLNKPAFVYQNQTDTANRYLKVRLEGLKGNTDGLGAKVTIYHKGKLQLLEQSPARGYLSSVSPTLHFGVGKAQQIDSLRVVWLSGKQQVLTNVATSRLLILNEKDAAGKYFPPKPAKPVFEEITSPVGYAQEKNRRNDFKRQPLLVNAISFSGPCMAKADVNGDGLEDVFVGGEANQQGALFIQQKNGKFSVTNPFGADKGSEDTDALFFDANGDGKLDLYIVSGGYHDFQENDPLLQDRLYLGDGKGGFKKSTGTLPAMASSKSCVVAGDFNGDGKADLFVGGRVIPGRFPETPKSYLLINDGRGKFSDRIKQLAPELEFAGMVTDAAVTDLNGDRKADLIVVGDWMPVTAYINEGGRLKDKTDQYFDKKYSGFWNTLQLADLNGDGRQDLIIGNLGLNSQCKVSDSQPAELLYKDFDDNGAVDPILCFYLMGKSYPYVTRDEMLDQMSVMRPRFPDYKSYSEAGLKEIFTEEELEGVKKLSSNYLKTAFFERTKNGKFALRELPVEAQFSPVFTITPVDYDKDGVKDLILCGNLNQSRLRFGKYDANHGVLLKGIGGGRFRYIPQAESGFKIKGDVRSALMVNNTLLLGVNQDKVKAYRLSGN